MTEINLDDEYPLFKRLKKTQELNQYKIYETLYENTCIQISAEKNK